MPRRKNLPSFGSYKEAGDWLDSHTTADIYAKPAKVAISPTMQVVMSDSESTHVETISLEKQMSRQIWYIAQLNGISARSLLKTWLREKIREHLRT